MTLETINQFFLNITNSSWFLGFKFFVLLLDLAMIGFLVFFLLKTKWFRWLILWDLKEYLTYRHHGLPKIEKKWVKIKERLELATEPEAKLAIIEAGSLLDGILKSEGFAGKTLGERLARLNVNIISNVEEVKEAYKIHSNIIHDPSYRLDMEEAKNILDEYEKSLVDLQAL